MKQYRNFKGIYYIENKKELLLLTKSISPGNTVYGEHIIRENDSGKSIEYRSWDPERSKLAAALRKEISQIGIKENDYVLYLGCSSGTTVSHVSDIIGSAGLVFALDFAPRMMRDMVFVAEKRKNIAPILADANHPEGYAHRLCLVDTVFMDIAQRNQTEIFLKNCRLFLRSGGFGILALKARSVDVTRNPKDIYRQVRSDLEKEMTIVDYRELDPFEKDHAMFVVKKK